MKKITVGLAVGKKSLFDKKTNTNFTLRNPVREITYTKDEEIEDIIKASIAVPPSLIIYKGEISQAAIDKVHTRYDSMLRGKGQLMRNLSGDMVEVKGDYVLDRTDDLITNNKHITQSVETVEAAATVEAVTTANKSTKKATVTKVEEQVEDQQEVPVEVEKEVIDEATEAKKTKSTSKTTKTTTK